MEEHMSIMHKAFGLTASPTKTLLPKRVLSNLQGVGKSYLGFCKHSTISRHHEFGFWAPLRAATSALLVSLFGFGGAGTGPEYFKGALLLYTH